MEVAVRSEMSVNIYTNPHSRKSQETSFFINSGACQLLLIIKGYMILSDGASFKKPTRHTNYPNLFCYKTLHVLVGIFSAHHQFYTVHSALLSFMHVFDDRFQAE
jgi:hypothetical membrane protein